MKKILYLLFLLPVFSYAQNTFPATGNVGIGTTSPQRPLHVNGVVRALTFEAYNGVVVTAVRSNDSTAGDIGTFSGHPLKIYSNNSEKIRVLTNGNVGIGTTTPGSYKLAVEGTIGARRVKVTQQSTWADFVFDKEYRLPSLQEVENYISTNKHLPGIPSAAEVDKEGIDIGDMNKNLLQKVEELTLYLIEQQKQLKLLQNEIDQLKALKK